MNCDDIYCYICTLYELMRFDIVEIEELSGPYAHIYSVSIDNAESTLIDNFFESNKQYKKELQQIASTLKNMGCRTGCRRGFFTMNEGSPGDGVSVLKAGQMRLYCIY